MAPYSSDIQQIHRVASTKMSIFIEWPVFIQEKFQNSCLGNESLYIE